MIPLDHPTPYWLGFATALGIIAILAWSFPGILAWVAQ